MLSHGSLWYNVGVLKTINTSLYDFATFRDPEANCVYVDKTAQLYEICKPSADRIYYLPRPRRFGKSLMISTLKYLFLGRRDLFKGLAIDSMDWNWEKEVYPVLHLDMSQIAAADDLQMCVKLQNLLKGKCHDFGLEFDESIPPSSNFMNLLRGLARISPNGRYVVLVDE